MKKKIIAPLVLLAVLAALIAVYLFVVRDDGEDGEEPAVTAEKLLQVERDGLTYISYNCVGDVYGFVRDLTENKWVLEGEEEFPLSNAATVNFENALINAEILSEAGNGGVDRAQYGLDDPVMTICFRQVSEGRESEEKIMIGDEEPLGSGRYVTLSTAPDTVYVTGENIYTYFCKTRKDLFEGKLLPSINPSHITGIMFTLDGYENYDLLFEENEEAENPDSVRARGEGKWKLLKKSSGEVTEGGPENLEDILNTAASIEFIETVDYREENLAEYGIDYVNNGLFTVWYDGKQLQLVFGNRTENGNYYVNVDGTPWVYVIEKSLVDCFAIQPEEIPDAG